MTPTKPTQYPQLEPVPALEVHPSVSPLAAELLMKTARALMIAPNQYDQSNGHHGYNTPCCILGHMFSISGTQSTAFLTSDHNLLGLTHAQYMALFSVNGWPKHLKPPGSYFSEWRKIPASVGVARIEHMLANGQ